ncbi:MAG: hypothetical protein QOF58_2682 [Pseudonocardiales bacterium]|jgi:prepilin-type N-terminal cleavage/methylation domain-containing protein|nr:hypothetical protein [Marmoricola sp.]MDT7784263.1 hypothetical protein [Pseudonocardiales bacterium]
MSGRCRREDGLTLVEVLLAITILGVGVVAIVGGMMTSIKVSDQGRRDAAAQVAVRAYADFVMDRTYQDCPVTTQYAGFTATGWTTTMVARYWNPNVTGSTGTFGSCPSPDEGIQKLTLTVVSTDGAGTTQSLSIVKRRTT